MEGSSIYLIQAFFLVHFTSLHGLPCGPDGKCYCSTEKMDCSRTLLSLERICEVVGTNMSDFNISALYASDNGIVDIGLYDLRGCESLVELRLNRNDITHIEPLAFHNLNSLRLLDLSDNKLTVYYKADQQLAKLPVILQTFMINGNVKGSINGDLVYPNLGYLKNLKALFLDGLPHRHFPVEYRDLVNLENLTVSGLIGKCSIKEISNLTFANMIYLRKINISYCGVENIDAGAFMKLSKLQILDLSQNMRLGFKVVRNISYSLQYTNIQFLNISKIYTTYGITTEVRSKDICYLRNTTLREIALSSNRIFQLETNAIILLPTTLQVVHVEDNKFTFGPYVLQFGCGSNVTHFYGHGQSEGHSPTLYFTEPREDRPTPEIDFDDCPYMKPSYLRNISKMIGEQCHYIEPKQLTFNSIKFSWPEKLKVIEMANSRFPHNIPTAIQLSANNSLESVDFSRNVLSQWNGAIGPLPNLRYVDMSQNFISFVTPSTFIHLTAIENLQIQKNFFGVILSYEDQELPLRIFKHIKTVKTLNLSSNIISYIPKRLFSKLSKLESLDLSLNNIESWTTDVSNLNELLHLNLSYNFIRYLPEALTSKLVENSDRRGMPFTLNLRNITITYGCQQKQFFHWMVKYRDSMVGFDDYIFVSETGRRISAETFVQNVQKLDKRCRSYTVVIVLATIGISVFLTAVLCGIVYKNRWKIRYLIRQTKVRHFGYRNIENHSENDEYMYKYDAFISYADENARFILRDVSPNLENRGIKLCLHDRDFIAGHSVADNIMEAIQNSKKTVAILSKAFLRSRWCIYEFNMARMESIYSRQGYNHLLMVMFEDVPVENMTNEMLQWVRSNTYLEYTTDEHGEQLFWDNLREAVNE